MKKKLNKRILSALLAFVTFLSCCPVMSLASDGFVITTGGEAVTRVSFDKHGKLEIAAENIPEGTYQWQIKIPGTDIWVDIQGQVSQTMDLSYAIVGSLLDGDSASLRCAAISGGEEVAHTAVLQATVTEKAEEEHQKSADVIVVPAPEAPTEAATEAPAEEFTEAATEAATEASELEVTETEPASEAPTEAPVEEITEAVTEAPAEPAPEAPTAAPTEAATEAATEVPELEITETEPATEVPTEAPIEETTEATTEAVTEETTESRHIMMFAARSTATTETAELDVVKITVQFLRKDGEENKTVFKTYEADLTKGTPFNASVPVPKFAGYEAICGDATIETADDKDVINLNYASVTVDVNIVVWYEPVNVGYKVRYYKQAVYSDIYEEDTTLAEPKEGPTGSYPTDIDKEIPGFTKLYNQPEVIAADGSTVFQLYYDRNYYLYNFVLDGGYGVEPVYARYGTMLTVPDPVRVGWIFAGWDLKTDAGYDDVADTLHSHIGIGNQTYKARWTTTDTVYSVAYWVEKSNGEKVYIGSSKRIAKSDTEVSGIDDLNSVKICGNLENGHVHTEPCYTATHTHTAECISGMNLSVSNVSGADREAFAALGVESGYLYSINVKDQTGTWYKLRIGNAWYEGNSSMQASVAIDSATVIATGAWAGQEYTAKKYHAKGLACGESAELTCEISNTHIHTDECKGISNGLKFKRGDQDIVVEGNGSTVVNVYYEYREYTLKFYYAATTGGTDTDKDKDSTTYDSIHIVGGSTNYFGSYGPDESDDLELLKNMWGWRSSNYWGTVDELPSLTEDDGAKRGYTPGTLVYDNGTATDTGDDVTFHYISFKARYGDDISNMWPCGVFNSVTRTDKENTNEWSGTEAFVSAWNGEHHVKYSQTHSNETIKGVYEKLDDEILFASQFEEDDEISFLCFWENGANGVTWNAPELYIYNVWLPCSDEVYNALPEKERRKKGDNAYKLYQTFETCDNSFASEQTGIAISGYTEDYSIRSWSAYFIGEALKNKSSNYYYIMLNDDEDKKYQNNTVYSGGWSYVKELKIFEQDNGKYLLYDAELYDPDNPVGSVNHEIYREAYTVDFYYEANRRTLYFWNHDGYLQGGSGSPVKFGQSLLAHRDHVNAEFMKSHYPKALEPDAYEFDAWYTTEDCLPNTQMDWEQPMPDSDMTVYAHWVPKTYDISFYVTYSGASGEIVEERVDLGKVTHGTPIDTQKVLDATAAVKAKMPEDVDFIGWFYENETGDIVAFDPENMPVSNGMKLFAQWKTDTPAGFTVEYYYMDNGVEKSLGEPTTGKAYVSSTRTFLPKAFAGYFPKKASTSLVIDMDPAKNVARFEYEAAKDVPYTIKCWDVTNKKWLREEAETTNTAVLDISAPYIDGYVATVGYTRLYLKAEGENVVIFEYTENKTDASYVIKHVLQDVDSGNYTEVYSIADGIVEKGTAITVAPLSLTGFTYVPTRTTVFSDTTDLTSDEYRNSSGFTINLPDKGMEVTLYYSRNTYDYTIQYVDDITNDKLGEIKFEDVRFGKTVKYDPPEKITHEGIEYTLKDGEADKTFTVDANDDQVFKYYYEGPWTTTYYIAITPGSGSPGGTCTPDHEIIKGPYKGATATANTGFYFAGWYIDAEGKNPVTDAHGKVEGNKFIPKTGIEGTFRALFKPYTLTISQTGMKDSDSAVYEVVRGTNEVVARVMVTGNSSVTIQQIFPGTYTVREISGNWTWTYGVSKTEGNPVTVDADQNNTVSFDYSNSYIGSCWLHSENRN